MNKFSLFFVSVLALSCGGKDAPAAAEDAPAETVQTPVTVTHVETVALDDYIELNATSAYLQTNFIKASTAGYLKSINVTLGQAVQAGQVAFVLQTKEAHALGNTINELSPSFHFSGLISIKATAGGYVQELNHQAGDYVQDGEQLATVADAKSFGFMLNLPYELHALVHVGQSLEIDLPDGTHMNGTVSSILPQIDSVSQTQVMRIKLPPGRQVPQNLIAKVRIVKSHKENVTSLPKAAVLADEAQTNFWVMKMADSVTAVKVPVVRGLESGDRVEIIRPQLSANDLILLTGNYGLPDTARVKIVKAEQ